MFAPKHSSQIAHIDFVQCAGALKEAKMIKRDEREREGCARQGFPVAFPFEPLRFLEKHVRVTTCVFVKILPFR